MNDWKKQLAEIIKQQSQPKPAGDVRQAMARFIALSDLSGRLPGGRNHIPEDKS